MYKALSNDNVSSLEGQHLGKIYLQNANAMLSAESRAAPLNPSIGAGIIP